MLKKIVVITTILNVFFLFVLTVRIARRSEIIINTSSERMSLLRDNNEKMYMLHFFFEKETANLLLDNIAENEKNIKKCTLIMQEIELHPQDMVKNIIRADRLNALMIKIWKSQRKMAEMLNNKITEEDQKQEKKEINARKTNRAFFLSKKPT